VGTPQTMPAGPAKGFMTDPDGEIIELIQPPK
jgi:hypothetical protein